MQTRAPDGGWAPVDFDGLDGRIELSAVGCTLAMRDVYDGIPPDQLDMRETGDHEE